MNSKELFARDTTVIKKSDNLFITEVSENWSIGNTANGGYSMTLAAKAMSEFLDHKDPLSISAHYLDRVDFGPTELHITHLNTSRSLSTARVEFMQNNKIKIIFIGTFTDFSFKNDMNIYEREVPNFPDYDTCEVIPYKEGFNPKLDKNIEKAYSQDSLWWKKNNESSSSTLNLYMSWPEKDDIDLFDLVLFLDATTPPIYNKLGTVGWVPTISLASHVRGLPSEGPLKVVAKTEFVTGGFMEEDREIWDSSGKLVGQSKQMAKLRIKK